MDDHPENLLALETVLEPLGQRLVRASSGPEALRHLLNEDFALVLLDVQMPGMDGFETADLIRRRERSRLTPIIFMTALSKGEDLILRGYEHGAVDYILKPFVPEILRAKVKVFVELHEKTRIIERQARELARSNSDLEQFAAVASHDLQEPLRKISGFAQMLQKRYSGKLDAQADEFLAQIVGGAARLQSLISALLEYSRLSFGPKDVKPVDLEKVFTQTIDDLQVLIRETGGQVTHDPLPTVPADATSIARVFQNLVANGLKFRGDRPPKVHVWAQKEDGGWVFSVKDEGIGIDSRFHDRVFQLFRRLQPRHLYEGAGIGLAVCKRVVEAHGGRIWVESQPGQGAVFRFTLPERAP